MVFSFSTLLFIGLYYHPMAVVTLGTATCNGATAINFP